ncbi:MAG: electron transport complex subunit RsxB [Gammaproteobacteria bacterium]|nr:MAG: electron transport complex subunit RsxB [Gammaproteobacteria bacterium]
MVWLGLVILVLATAAAGYLLGRSRASGNKAAGDNPEQALVERVNALLPQTQCGQCRHPGCRPYAEAIVLADEPINRCPPGGSATIADLATLLGREVIPLNSDYGEEAPAKVALVDEPECIGCTLCIQACPVDAIIGASKQMHVVVEDLCTGCELCLPPCPVDCIHMVEPASSPADWSWPKPA